MIGGGDWTPSRIIPDCAKAWAKGKAVNLRNPESTRPWQHVLEPLSGYLKLANYLMKHNKYNGEAFNFGPNLSYNNSVIDLVNEMIINWPRGSVNNLSETKVANNL